jgi:hypothetical protein
MKAKIGEKFVKACPRCFSTDITITDRIALVVYRELYYRCRKCGLEAKMFPEVAVSELKKLAKKKNKKSVKLRA